MDALAKVWPLPLGFLAGLLVTGYVMRWLLLVLATVGALPPRLGTAEQRPRKATVLHALLHPLPVLLVAALAFGVPAIARSAERTEWLWALAGLIAAPVLNAVLVYRALRTGRQSRPLDLLKRR